ncbi:MAG: hypothetical protein IJ649_05565 [Oscillospiraceae bacterium]|nr:hypothetical protein [Oscillospiraceae bacterium]
MKKILALLLIFSLLLSLSVTASAADERSTECDNVMLTVTGCCTTPGADGAPRVTLFLSAGNKNDSPREVHADGCVVGPCELPVNLSLTLDAWESRETVLVIPLAALKYFDLSGFSLDYIRLRLSVSGPDGTAVPAEPLTLRTGELPKPERRAGTEDELFARFGARVLALGADFDGRFSTVWFLLENNNDFPLRLGGSADGAVFAGCTAQPHTRLVFRLDFPADASAAGHSFALRCSLTGYADGTEKPPVDMASFRAELTLTEGTITVDGVESENDQSYIARVGLRNFNYDECLPIFEVDPDAPVLPARESGLVSLACCGGYEVLAGAERMEGMRAVLPLTLRSFTGEALTLSVSPNADALSLPCLTADVLKAPANGSAAADFVFDASGLAYTPFAGTEDLGHGFTLTVGPASDPGRAYGTHPAEGICAAEKIEALQPCEFDEAAAGGLRIQLLGLDISDGLSVWLRVRNDSDGTLSCGDTRMEGMLNSSVVSFVNSGSRIPAGADCLVLLRAAEFDEDGTADPFAYHLPALSELNTLKLRLGPGEDACSVTVMFQHNGNIMLASASVSNVEIPEE